MGKYHFTDQKIRSIDNAEKNLAGIGIRNRETTAQEWSKFVLR